MSKLIKFPSQLTPTRVTPTLIRTDELLPNPVSGVQQATGNGAAYWKFSYEFKDLSESERDIVQAFLVKCKGALSSFKVEDPANYQLKGTVSSWIDVFSGYGSFNIAAGSNASLIKINSWFYGTPRFVSHITEEQVLRQEWRDYISTGNVSWAGEGSSSKVSSLDLGKAYIQRIKFFQHPTRVPTSINLRVSSGSGAYVIQSSTRVFSSDNVTAPFVVGRAVSGIGVNPVAWTTADGKVGDYFGVSDYRLSRCALVANSENLFTHSNNFGHANWIKQSAVVASGYSDKTPTGVTSGSWKLYCNTTGSGLHYASQLITKVATEDLYTLSIYAKASEMSEMYLQLYYP